MFLALIYTRWFNFILFQSRLSINMIFFNFCDNTLFFPNVKCHKIKKIITLARSKYLSQNSSSMIIILIATFPFSGRIPFHIFISDPRQGDFMAISMGRVSICKILLSPNDWIIDISLWPYNLQDFFIMGTSWIGNRTYSLKVMRSRVSQFITLYMLLLTKLKNCKSLLIHLMCSRPPIRTPMIILSSW